MSWAFSASCPALSELEQLALIHCKGCLESKEDAFSISETFNVSGMYDAALKGTTLEKEGIRGLGDRESKDVLRIVEGMIRYFQEHEVALRGMNPSNGWGSYESALEALMKIYAHALLHNLAVFKVT